MPSANKTIRIPDLAAGSPLDGDLYSERNELLLVCGLPLTEQMVDTLRNSDADVVFLRPPGMSKTEEVHRSLDLHQDEERALTQALVNALDSAMKREPMHFESKGPAHAAAIDTELQGPRWEARASHWQQGRDEGVQLAQGICEGTVRGAAVGNQAMRLVDDMLLRFSTDPSLTANFLHLRGLSPYLYEHTLNRTTLAIKIATHANLDRQQVLEIGVAALLADVGMGTVPDSVLNLPRTLTPAEFVDVQKHTANGLHAIGEMPGLPYFTKYVVYQHHEAPDGLGYPRRRTKSMIHASAQIVRVADAYDALISDRPWRKAFHPYRAMELLIRDAGKGSFDTEAVRGLLRYLSLYPIGSLVALTSGEIAKVVHANGARFDRPCVAILVDSDGTQRDQPVIKDLTREEHLRIASIVEDDQQFDLGAGF